MRSILLSENLKNFPNHSFFIFSSVFLRNIFILSFIFIFFKKKEKAKVKAHTHTHFIFLTWLVASSVAGIWSEGERRHRALCLGSGDVCSDRHALGYKLMCRFYACQLLPLLHAQVYDNYFLFWVLFFWHIALKLQQFYVFIFIAATKPH